MNCKKGCVLGIIVCRLRSEISNGSVSESVNQSHGFLGSMKRQMKFFRSADVSLYLTGISPAFLHKTSQFQNTKLPQETNLSPRAGC